MFSGGDSSDGLNSLNQLGAYGFVNQVAVSNAMAAGQNIDWAQLAQQWIQMRDNAAIETKPESNASNNNKLAEASCSSLRFEEKGEADMDMDDEEQCDDKVSQRTNNDFASNSTTHNNINQPWFFSDGRTSQIAPQATGNSQWMPWSNRDDLPHNLSNQNNVGIRPANPTAHIPSLLKITVPHPNEIRVMPDVPNQTENMMDAAKRKGLPAWIREGLEKMEREKQKQLEKELQKQETDSSEEDNASDKKNLIKSSSNGVVTGVLDEDSSDNDDFSEIKNSKEDSEIILKNANEEDAPNSPVGRTYEQRLSNLMIAVRRTLTELLLEATNEEISKVAEESIKSFKAKASSAQVIRKSALSTLTGKLGLAAYADSSSENSSDDERDPSKKTTGRSDSENDSEEEIRNTIRLKRRTFIKTSEEIEDRVAMAAAREEEKLKYFLRKEEEEEREYKRKKQERSSLRDTTSSSQIGHNVLKGYEKDFGEITETKIQQPNGKRQRDRGSRRERTTRFSDNKDKYVALPNAAATFLNNINSAANSGTNNITPSLSSNIQRPNIPDINGLLPNYTNAGMAIALNAADAALEKALKRKSSASPEKHSRRTNRDRDYVSSKKRQRTSDSKKSRSRSRTSSSSTSSSSSSSSSDSDSSSSTSRSSHHSKYSHRSATKNKSHHASEDRQYEKSHKNRKGDDRKYSSSSYKKRDSELSGSRYRRNGSSDSDDDYRRRHKYDSHYSRNSSHSRSYTSARRDREREHSRSQSRSSYSSSSNRRQ